jgi:hypothetical protein
VKRNAANATVLVLASMILATMPLGRTATAQEAGGSEASTSLHRRWLTRVDAWHGIPPDLALRFGESALSVGLTPSEAARLLNEPRFVAAVGAPDQGWGLLEAMVESPDSIADALALLRARGDQLTLSGDTSFQYAFMVENPELRNPYLADLGRMIATRPDGMEVLVDLETGRQVISRSELGIPLRAPGGGPLPTPSISPEEAAAQMWEDAGIDPDDPNPGQIEAAGRPEAPTGPGFNFETEEPPQGLLTPGLYLVLGAFLIAWMGYALVAAARRFRRS